MEKCDTLELNQELGSRNFSSTAFSKTMLDIVLLFTLILTLSDFTFGYSVNFKVRLKKKSTLLLVFVCRVNMLSRD